MTVSDLTARVRSRYQRTAARLLFRRPVTINTPVPLISFTFDDFPRSALLTAGAMLKRFGLSGTYYASFGLMGTDGPTGEIFIRQDIDLLYEQGHELGCHTFAHSHSWETSAADFERSVLDNRIALDSLRPGAAFSSFSYPISPPRPETKRSIGRHFASCRGGGQEFNSGTADLNYLAAAFMEKSRDSPEVLRNLIDRNREARGWLVLATHDVSQNPTSYGCTPDLFESILRYAVESGASILPVAGALQTLTQTAASRRS